jgi:2-amino-4-hydroxy-6-hydroxymethyldihydropteridine diphosphokinase
MGRIMKWTKVYLGLGSNVGAPRKNLEKAIDYLKKNIQIKVRKVSPFYQTSPLGPKQKAFLNGAILIETLLEPLELLADLKTIEHQMKRKPTIRWGPRIIDLDILSYGKLKMRSKKLTLPHPQLHKRRFVLEPLKKLNAQLKPAGFKKTISQLLRELTDPSQKVRLVKNSL